MIIRYHKGRNAHVLTCIRADGSTTWNRFPDRGAMIVHDLIHYAVETTLHYRNGFFGLVAAGRDIPSFLLPAAGRTIPPAAPAIEFVVGLFQNELLAGPSNDAAFLATLSQACANGGIQPPAMTADQVAAIRLVISELLTKWRVLDEGAALELEFPLVADRAWAEVTQTVTRS